MTKSLEEVLCLETGSLAFLEACSESEKQRLLELFEAAHEVQRQQTEEAIEAGLKIIPGFLRKTVRKVLGGG